MKEVDYIDIILEDKFDKFKEYEDFLSKEVFGHKVKVLPGLRMLIVNDVAENKNYRIINGHFVDEDKIYKADFNDMYKDFVIKSNLFFANIFGSEYMEDAMKYFKTLKKENSEEIALGQMQEDYWRYDEYCKADEFYYDVIKALGNGFAKIEAKNAEKEM